MTSLFNLAPATTDSTRGRNTRNWQGITKNQQGITRILDQYIDCSVVSHYWLYPVLLVTLVIFWDRRTAGSPYFAWYSQSLDAVEPRHVSFPNTTLGTRLALPWFVYRRGIRKQSRAMSYRTHGDSLVLFHKVGWVCKRTCKCKCSVPFMWLVGTITSYSTR